MSLAHLEVNFMQGDGYGSMFILHVAIQCDQHPLFKMLSFLQCVLLPSVSKSSGYESISLYFTSNGSAFLPVQCYRCWWLTLGPVFTEQVLLPTDLSQPSKAFSLGFLSAWHPHLPTVPTPPSYLKACSWCDFPSLSHCTARLTSPHQLLPWKTMHGRGP